MRSHTVVFGQLFASIGRVRSCAGLCLTRGWGRRQRKKSRKKAQNYFRRSSCAVFLTVFLKNKGRGIGQIHIKKWKKMNLDSARPHIFFSICQKNAQHLEGNDYRFDPSMLRPARLLWAWQITHVIRTRVASYCSHGYATFFSSWKVLNVRASLGKRQPQLPFGLCFFLAASPPLTNRKKKSTFTLSETLGSTEIFLWTRTLPNWGQKGNK